MTSDQQEWRERLEFLVRMFHPHVVETFQYMRDNPDPFNFLNNPQYLQDENITDDIVDIDMKDIFDKDKNIFLLISHYSNIPAICEHVGAKVEL